MTIFRNHSLGKILLLTLFCCLTVASPSRDLLASHVIDHPSTINKWAEIFTPSTLSFQEKTIELEWFREASKPFRGIKIRSVGEDIETSFWESQYLSRAFTELTGIIVQHEVTGEAEVVERLMAQLSGGQKHYDIYVTDADLIGTHLRNRDIVILSDYIKNSGKPYTNPNLDLDDFINLKSGQDYEGNQLQIPDYQFMMLYWFRHDWFSDPEIQQAFRSRYGYELGVPLNWSAYEDIAQFFNRRQMKNPNDSEVIAFGHVDYALPGPWLGWRFSDAFFATAGMGDKGLPNGLPVDEWGIRVENKIPVGASVERGGAINSPAAKYGLETWLHLLENYAPPSSYYLDWINYGSIHTTGTIAQAWYWCPIYTSLNPEYNKVGSPICDKNGNPVWRIAPIPKGRYWEKGMKQGYMDSGSWTIPASLPDDYKHASWLWAQFCLSKTVALKKFFAGATPVRKSTIFSQYLDEHKSHYGGLIELLRSPVAEEFSDGGPNVPDYQLMSTLWSQNIAMAINHQKTPQESLDNLAHQLDTLMSYLDQEAFSPQLNPKQTRDYWLNQPGAPKKEKKTREKPRTITYEALLAGWEEKR